MRHVPNAGALVEPDGERRVRNVSNDEGLAMMLRATTALVLILIQTGGVSAGERTTGLLHRVSCTVVRFYVGKYSEGAAEAWARGKGATDADIEAARRCLGGASTQTAQAAAWH
jgi:hypothetical protein